MSDNSGARRKLERIFGKICFIEELGIRNIPPEERRKIKGYTKYDDKITFHHVKEKCKGGKATPENGALVKGYNHRWLHSLPEDQKQKINDCMMEFKAAFIAATNEGLQTINGTTIQLDFNTEDYIEIPVFDNTQLDNKKKEKFNRAKVKREFQKQVEDELDTYYNDEEIR